ncbi:hypothetical protein RJ639_025798, partial [Escallonia herrerae]
MIQENFLFSVLIHPFTPSSGIPPPAAIISLLEKLGSLALEELFLASGVESEAKRIEDTLSIIKAVLLDAEEKQEKNHR